MHFSEINIHDSYRKLPHKPVVAMNEIRELLFEPANRECHISVWNFKQIIMAERKLLFLRQTCGGER